MMDADAKGGEDDETVYFENSCVDGCAGCLDGGDAGGHAGHGPEDSADKPGAPAGAPQITGELGSPSATTTISGKQLPPPDPKFGGVIKDERPAIQSVVGAARRAAQGRTQRPAHHHG